MHLEVRLDSGDLYTPRPSCHALYLKGTIFIKAIHRLWPAKSIP